MDPSFQEKSLWVTFISLTGSCGFYFAKALPDAPSDVQPQQVALFAGMIVLLVIAQVVGHIVIALRDRRAGADERDRLIGLQGTRNAAYVLATGVFCALCAGLLTEGNFVFTHVLLGAWVLAQLVEIGSQLWLYRRRA